MGPITTPLSEGYMYRVEGKGYSNRELRSIQDWVIRPRLRTVEGVADVNSLGGEVKVFEVVADPEALLAHGLAIDEPLVLGVDALGEVVRLSGLVGDITTRHSFPFG